MKTAGPTEGGDPKTAEKPVRLNDKNKALGDHLRDQLMTALGTAALQHLPAVLGCHTNQEAVRFRSAPGVWLKRTLALLGSRHISPRSNIRL